ncbi:MAG: quinone-dependent dihydroorotate dehydrogenase [Chitinophagaceae bacterium]|nr:MAG: quinone-dependent dihydroorotate dehydrogenase [Chitinophagaceae bacterium]
MYVTLRKLLFKFPPEAVHYFAMNSLQVLCSLGLGGMLRSSFRPPQSASFNLGKLVFNNPVGLGAGFDKNARWLRELETLGFGFVEIGTVTPLPQAGNDKPRLFRLPEDGALINRMGFNNDGVEVVTARLRKWREKHPVQLKGDKAGLVIGGNIGKNKVTPNEDAWKDYEICFKELHPYVDYFVVNVSSPNTPGLRELQEKESLRRILMHLQMINNSKAHAKPILLKIAPDLTIGQIDDVIDLSMEIQLDGLVISNTTINRNGLQTPGDQLEKIGAGGLSGKPVRGRSTEIVEYVTRKTNGTVPVIASGGIFTAADAAEKLSAGAALVQVWTGFVYEGPSIVKKIMQGLVQLRKA